MDALKPATLPLRSVVLRLLLLMLAISALLGIAALLTDFHQSGKLMGTAISLAVMCALFLPASPATPGMAISRIGAAWCGYLLVAEACVLIAIWTDGRWAGESMGSAGVLLGSLATAATGIRRLDNKESKTKLAEQTLVYGCALATAFGLMGPYTSWPSSGFFLNEWGIFLGASCLGAACMTGFRQGTGKVTRWAGVIGVLAILAALLGLSAIAYIELTQWGNPSLSNHKFGWLLSPPWLRVAAIGSSTAGATIAVAIFSSMASLNGLSRHLPTLATAMTAAAGSITTYVVAMLEVGTTDYYWRLIGSCVLVDVCSLMACIILHKLNSSEAEGRSRHRVFADAQIRCPRCRKAFTATAGESCCPNCELIVILGFRESRCSNCDFDLRQTSAGSPCPECGRETQPQVAVLVTRAASQPQEQRTH